MRVFRFLTFSLMITCAASVEVQADSTSTSSGPETAIRVLYVGHEPGRWHDYPVQRAAVEALASRSGWQLEVANREDRNALMAVLAAEDFAAGQDVIVYNFCLANSRDTLALSNVIGQTETLGIPALLVHCTMHSWWDSFKKGRPIPGNAHGLARAHRKLLRQWSEDNPDYPDKPLPAWGDFTGIASTGHGPKKPIALQVVSAHPATASVPDNYSTGPTELYNNHYTVPGVIPLLEGTQGSEKAVVMWEAQQGRGRVIGLTLGHADDEWNDAVFLALIRDAVNYLAARPPEQTSLGEQ